MAILGDFRFAIRALLFRWRFTAAAVLTLALGIGANTTVFTMANALTLKGPPFREANRVMHIGEYDRARGPDPIGRGVSYADFVDFKEQNRTFVDMAMYGIGTYNISDDLSAPERLIGSRITPNLFSVIEYLPVIGRDFVSGEDQPAAAPVAIISYGLWQRRYSGAEDIVGRVVRVNAVGHTIVGVMPQGMQFPVSSDLWLTMPPARALADRGMRSGSDVIGRLRDGVSLEQARADLQGIAQGLESGHPETNQNIEATIIPFADRFNGNAEVLTALFGAVGFVLVIACANLASLLLAQAMHRTREIAIRIAVGAGRWQIMRQLLTESVLLSLAGGLAGLGLAVVAVDAIAGQLEGVGLPYWVDFSMDYRVVIQLVIVCFTTGVLFGVAPALRLARTDVQTQLKEGTPAAGLGKRSRKLSSILVTAEIAATLMLLVGAGLMIRSFLSFQMHDFGIPTERILTATLVLPEPKYSDAVTRVAFSQQLIERLRAEPGLEPVALASHAPQIGFLQRTVRTESNGPFAVSAVAVSAGYFDAIGMSIVRGRDFSDTDGRPGAEAVVVNERFAAQQWPGEDAVGRRIQLGDAPEAPWLPVIGISRSLPNADDQDADAIVYLPYRQEAITPLTIISQSPLAREAAVNALRTSVQSVDADLPIFNVRTLGEYLWRLNVGVRILSALLGAFAVFALVVSMVGVYSLTAYTVRLRTHEIGVRMALGAGSRSVVWLFARRGIIQLTIGLAVGMAGAWVVSRIIVSQVMAGLAYHVSPTDAVTFVAVPVMLAGVTLIACILPAGKAAKADPAAALRHR